MRFIADFHIHSKYSRATSPQMELECLDKWARIKGIQVLGTGDFTHPEWIKNLKQKLEPAEPGLFKLKTRHWPEPQAMAGGEENSPTRFILTAEISCIYSKKNKVRKIHIILFAPSFNVVEKINTQLGWIGNLKSDGRPILGLDAKELARIVFEISSECMVIPAHIWTPWFSIFGSKSGFNSIYECFGEYSKYIYAGETGLSSDPAMNWQWSGLDKISLISNSDSHSPQKIGREANVFDTELSYQGIFEALKNKDNKKFLSTIEFFPEEGKYHFDGHRSCEISLSPEESKKHNNICPKCGKPLVVGVLNRVRELADRPEGFKPKNAVPFKNLIPLQEIIAEALSVTVISKKVGIEYDKLIKEIGNEFKILLESTEVDLKFATLPEIADSIIKVREGKVLIEPGYDGVYGKIKIFGENHKKKRVNQKALF